MSFHGSTRKHRLNHGFNGSNYNHDHGSWVLRESITTTAARSLDLGLVSAIRFTAIRITGIRLRLWLRLSRLLLRRLLSVDSYGSGYGSVHRSLRVQQLWRRTRHAYAPQSQPPVIINQNRRLWRHRRRRCPGTGTESFYRKADYYLIAFADHTIQAALSYRVEGDTIFWTTREHEERHAPLSSVDRRFTEQMNRDRHVEIRLQ